MNPRQRRAVFLLLLSFAGLVAVFFLVSGYVSDVRREVGPKRTVLALKKDAPPFRTVTDDMVEERQLPERYLPESALTDRGQIVGLEPTTQLTAGSILQEGMLAPQPSLEEGQRELAILVNAETGVAGKIQPGSRVDMIATYAAENEGDANEAVTVVSNARILDVGQTQVRGGNDQQQDPTQVVPVTFALAPTDVLRVQFAETFGSEVRLSLRRSGDEAPLKRKERRYTRPTGRVNRGGN